MTGVEFLKFYAELTSVWKPAVLNSRIDELLKRVDLIHAKDRPLRSYSKGMLQKIGVAQALIHDPELIILDEPMSGLDPDGRFAIAEIIQETARKGTAVFFSSHLLNDMEKLCRRLVVLKDGICIFEGETLALLETGGVGLEITYLDRGVAQNVVAQNQDDLQTRLKHLIGQGAVIVEVRQLRPSLEEIFVKMALRGRMP